MMSRLLALIVSLLLCALAACGDASEKGAKESPSPAASAAASEGPIVDVRDRAASLCRKAWRARRPMTRQPVYTTGVTVDYLRRLGRFYRRIDPNGSIETRLADRLTSLTRNARDRTLEALIGSIVAVARSQSAKEQAASTGGVPQFLTAQRAAQDSETALSVQASLQRLPECDLARP
jgi:hypothetical protein